MSNLTQPGAGLTDTEREALACVATGHEPDFCDCNDAYRDLDDRFCEGARETFAAVERIVAARTADLRAERDRLAAQVAAVEALLPTWTEATCQTDGAPCSWHRVAAECADELRATLATGAAEGGDES